MATAAAPTELTQSVYEYSFTPVNLKDINAFALPGGPMFVQRGTFDAAAEEAEVAGVMAHELSRVLLRHGTANASNVAAGFSELMPRMVIVGEAVAQVEHRAIGLLAGTDNFSSTPLATRILSAHRVHR